MESVAAKLARQALGAAAASVLLIGAIYSGVYGAPQRTAARQRIEPPIKVQSIVLAEAAVPVASAPVVLAETKPPPHPVCPGSCRRAPPARAPMPQPRPVAEPVALALIAPAPEPSLQTRLFAPVGAFRNQVARFISRL
ncbi:MAG TPA: hypothetical protein VKS78_10200 [Roseiarcus sp.]|nr:hypothetical protein [Roseiarcus sp.]